METKEINSLILTNRLSFSNPHTKAYLHELEEYNSEMERYEYFIEIYVIIPSNDDEILELMKYSCEMYLGIIYTEEFEDKLRECLNGRSSFDWKDDQSLNVSFYCGDRGQGTYFKIYYNDSEGNRNLYEFI